MKKRNQASVQSINPCKSVNQTNYDIAKEHGGMFKVETLEDEGSVFIIQIPYNTN